MTRPTSRWRAVAMSAAMTLSLAVCAPPVGASTVISVTEAAEEINDDGDCSLQEAIYSANYDANIAPDPADPSAFIATGCAAGDGDDTIAIPSGWVLSAPSVIPDAYNYAGPTATPIIVSTITIQGNGARFVHGSGANVRAFAVADTGDLTIFDMHLKGFIARGGDGHRGGGGGLGAGGAIYVHGGRLHVERTTFELNGAVGGNGGEDRAAPYYGWSGGGGGGGLGGDGGGTGSGADAVGGSGGGGARGNGGNGNLIVCPGGWADCSFGFGGGGGGTLTDGYDATSGDAVGGTRCGGAGSAGGSDGGHPGGDATCRGGGGGGGQAALFPGGVLAGDGGDGGRGGYGGGGGGAGWGDALFGGGGDGGHGGFGAGGGAAGADGAGGDGGFGGGGGAGGGPGGPEPGDGGTYGGHGSDAYGGGGGALGGAIFGDEAAITVINSTFTQNYVTRGVAGGSGAANGADAGGAIFTEGGALTIINSTIAGNEATGAGGGIAVYRPQSNVATSLTIWNTIVASNGAKECFLQRHPDAGLVSTTASGNLITANSPTDGIHHVVPCPAPDSTDDPGLQSLARNAPGLTPTMALSAGSPAIDAADNAFAPGNDQRGVGRPIGLGADIGAFEFSGAGPVTTIDLAPASPDGNNGWYVSSVDVSASATDADTSVAQTRCAIDPASEPETFADLPDLACGTTSVGSDGGHVAYAASVDTEGNVEIPVVLATFKVDRNDPTLSPTLNATTVVVGQAGVTASPNASDATSGVASESCDAVDTSTAGVHSVDCSATDNAGNTATVSIDYVVEYAILGFFEPAPGSRWLAGQTVPIKVALGDADGVRISDTEAAAMASSCQVTFTVTGVQTRTAQCLRYDPATDQFIFNWKLGKRPLGEVTITVTVSYAGTTSTTTLSEQVTIARK